jgi:hypothetical protein
MIQLTHLNTRLAIAELLQFRFSWCLPKAFTNAIDECWMRATREYLNLPHVVCLDSEWDAVVPQARIELSLGIICWKKVPEYWQGTRDQLLRQGRLEYVLRRSALCKRMSPGLCWLVECEGRSCGTNLTIMHMTFDYRHCNCSLRQQLL